MLPFKERFHVKVSSKISVVLFIKFQSFVLMGLLWIYIHIAQFGPKTAHWRNRVHVGNAAVVVLGNDSHYPRNLFMSNNHLPALHSWFLSALHWIPSSPNEINFTKKKHSLIRCMVWFTVVFPAEGNMFSNDQKMEQHLFYFITGCLKHFKM